jgi:tubulin polyglutamylase TTLL1/tubulin monoglycylase TTLL3/8
MLPNGILIRTHSKVGESVVGFEAEMIRSIPSRTVLIDGAELVANGFHVTLAPLASATSPLRQVDRMSVEVRRRDNTLSPQAQGVLNRAHYGRSRLKYETQASLPSKLPRIKLSIALNAIEEDVRRQPLTLPKLLLPQQMVSFEKAFRDKDWLINARQQISADTLAKLARGNGLAADEGGIYKYFLGKGNNGSLIKSLLQPRWWWTRTDSREDANLVWTQSRDLEWFKNAERAERQWVDSADNERIVCKVRFVADKAPKISANLVDISPLNLDALFTPESYQAGEFEPGRMEGGLRTHNKLEQTYHLSNKKALYMNLKKYCEATAQSLFDKVPMTFHIKSGHNDPEFNNFVAAYETLSQDPDMSSRNLWIVKPGENSNRGTGISVCSSIDQVRDELKPTVCDRTGRPHTYIVQKYLDRPYLIHKRKFDLRLYALMTSINGGFQGYYYSEGYIRTSSREFTLKNLDRMIHLTNDAVQKKGEDYGRFESGNKLSYRDFQRYLDSNYATPVSFQNDVLPKMVGLMKDTMLATFTRLDPRPKRHSFEVYGYDFMLDAELKPWLIEVNTNPCLELSAGTLARIIPQMLDNAFMIALDPYFSEPKTRRASAHLNKTVRVNKFQLIFNSRTDGQRLLEKAREDGTLEQYLALQLDLEELGKDAEEMHDTLDAA